MFPSYDPVSIDSCGGDHHVVPPLDLNPLNPPATVHRVHRLVKEEDGQLLNRRIIEKLGPRPSILPCSHVLAYAIDSVIMNQQLSSSGAIIFLATPLVPSCQDNNKCLVSCDGGPVVVKAVPRPMSSRYRGGDDPLREIAAMQLLHQSSTPDDDPHQVIPLLDCMQDQHYLYLVIPHLSGGSMFSRVKATGYRGLPEAEAASYFRQMAEGLLFMKETCGLAHHDVSLENAMLTSNNDQQGMVQIIDLGMCLRVPKRAVTPAPPAAGQQQPVCLLSPQRCSGKPAYVAPEVVREEACDPFASDIWSLGVCLYMMLTARPLYHSPSDLLFNRLSQPGGARDVVTAYENHGLWLPSCAKDLVCSMLDADPAKRPTLEEVLHHPFLLKHHHRVNHGAPTPVGVLAPIRRKISRVWSRLSSFNSAAGTSKRKKWSWLRTFPSWGRPSIASNSSSSSSGSRAERVEEKYDQHATIVAVSYELIK